MSPPAAQLLCEFCFVCTGPILTNLFSAGHFCLLNIRVSRALASVNLKTNNIPGEVQQQLRDAVKGKNIKLELSVAPSRPAAESSFRPLNVLLIEAPAEHQT